jgi:serine/threonine protein kinase
MHSHTSFRHGPDFVIISPLADLNLHEFFAGDYEAFQAHQQRFTPLHLLKEASFLAGALHFLHYGLRLRERRIACAHLDFKPENILVKWNPDTKQMPVGQWLVHDFGTARIKEPHEETNTMAPGDFLAHFSLTKAQRNPGPFQAPEVQPNKDRVVGRESDMWSFGCLLAVVISFALGGPRFVSALARSRYNSNQPDEGYTDDYFYTIENGRAVIKSTVVRCLQSLRTESPEDRWIGRTLDLVFKILVDTPSDRLKALETQDALDVICSEEGNTSLQRKCAWIEPEAPIPVTNLRFSGISSEDQSISYVDPPLMSPSSRPIPPRPHFPNPGPSSNLSPYDQNQYSVYGAQYSSQASQAQNLGQYGQAQAGLSRNPSIVLRTDTFSSHVISPPATPYQSSTPRTNLSDESSSMGQGSSLSSDITFTYIAVPPKTTKSVVCGHSARVGYISKTAVRVHNFSIQNTWVPRRPPKSPDRATNVYLGPECPQDFEWDLMSLCGSHLVLRARNRLNKSDCRVSLPFHS